MTTIVFFGGSFEERKVSIALARTILRTLPDALAWFWSRDGMVHDVAVPDLLGQEEPLDYVPARPAIFPNVEQALDTLPVEDPVFLLALDATGGESAALREMLERRGVPFAFIDANAAPSHRPEEMREARIAFREFLDQQIAIARERTSRPLPRTIPPWTPSA